MFVSVWKWYRGINMVLFLPYCPVNRQCLTKKIQIEKNEFRPSGAGGGGGGSLAPLPPKFFANVPFFSKSPRRALFEINNQKFT